MSFKYVDITTYSLHPGEILTNIGHLNNNGFTKFLFVTFLKVFGITAEQDAINTLYPVLSPNNKETRKYYNKGIEQEPNKVANDREVAKKLWDVSEQILKDHRMI